MDVFSRTAVHGGMVATATGSDTPPSWPPPPPVVIGHTRRECGLGWAALCSEWLAPTSPDLLSNQFPLFFVMKEVQRLDVNPPITLLCPGPLPLPLPG